MAVVCSCTCLNNCVNFFNLSLFLRVHVEMISFCTWLYVCGNAIFMNLSVCLWACYALVFVYISVGTLCSSQSLCLWEQHVLVSVCSVGMLCPCICLYVCGSAIFMELSVCLWECHVFVSLFASYGSCSTFCLWELYFHLSIYICSFNCISVGTLCSSNCLCFCGNCMFLFLSACLWECYVLVSIFMSVVVQCSCNCLMSV